MNSGPTTPDAPTNDAWRHSILDGPPALSAVIPDWDSLSWARRIAMQARYGFSDDGTLTLTLDQLARPGARKALQRSTVSLHGLIIPRGSLPGVDERLDELTMAGRIFQRDVEHDTGAFVQEGPDGSSILTARDFCAPLDKGFPEIKESDVANCDHESCGLSETPDCTRKTGNPF